MKLRDYQKKAIRKILKEKSNRMLGVAATGLGKSTMVVSLIDKVDKGILFISPTREIVFQTYNKVRTLYPYTSCGIEMGNIRCNGDELFVVTTIQTLRSNDRWKKFVDRKWDFIVVDEAHHAHPFNEYNRILSKFGFGKKRGSEPEGTKLLCLTATPIRSDGVALGHFCDTIVFNYDIRWGVENGWLVKPISRVVNFEDTVSDADSIVNAYVRYVSSTEDKTLIFTDSVKDAHVVAEKLRDLGVCAYPVWGTMDKIERKRILESFTNPDGEINVVTNFGVLTEGFDNPLCKNLIMGRAVSSKPLYVQMVGRILRPLVSPPSNSTVDERLKMIEESEKPFANIIDVVSITPGQTLVTFSSLYDRVNPKEKERRLLRRLNEEIEREEVEIVKIIKDVETTYFIVDAITGEIESFDDLKLLWIPLNVEGKVYWTTFVDKNPFDIHKTGSYFVVEENGQIHMFTEGGWSKRIKRPVKATYKPGKRYKTLEGAIKFLDNYLYKASEIRKVSKKWFEQRGLKIKDVGVMDKSRVALKVLTSDIKQKIKTHIHNYANNGNRRGT